MGWQSTCPKDKLEFKIFQTLIFTYSIPSLPFELYLVLPSSSHNQGDPRIKLMKIKHTLEENEITGLPAVY